MLVNARKSSRNANLVSMSVQTCSIHGPLRGAHANPGVMNAQKSSTNANPRGVNA